jgi:hypothetical protein
MKQRVRNIALKNVTAEAMGRINATVYTAADSKWLCQRRILVLRNLILYQCILTWIILMLKTTMIHPPLIQSKMTSNLFNKIMMKHAMAMGLRDNVERKCIVYGRIAALDAVDELKAYKENNGHLKVMEKQDASLYGFCSNVRQARKGKASYRLDTTRISALNSIGLDWNMRVYFHTKQNYNRPLQQDHDVEGLQLSTRLSYYSSN